jgi:hypothetical protein
MDLPLSEQDGDAVTDELDTEEREDGQGGEPADGAYQQGADRGGRSEDVTDRLPGGGAPTGWR